MAAQRAKLLTDQLRQAIHASGLTRYRIAKETGIRESTLSRFCNGRRGLSMKALNTLCAFLGLSLQIKHSKDPFN